MCAVVVAGRVPVVNFYPGWVPSQVGHCLNMQLWIVSRLILESVH